MLTVYDLKDTMALMRGEMWYFVELYDAIWCFKILSVPGFT